MNSAARTPIPRRTLLAGGLATLGLSAAGLVVYEASGLLGQHHPPTPYDDLLTHLPDRENAGLLGAATLAQEKSFDLHASAIHLRARLKAKSLAEAMSEDLRQRHLSEIRGWVLPETLTTLCAIVAKVS